MSTGQDYPSFEHLLARAVPLSLFPLRWHSPPQRFSLFSSAVTWSESGSGSAAIFSCLSTTPSCAIATSSGICRPSSSPLVLRDRFVLCRVSLVWVFSRLSWYPSPRSAVRTVEYAHADRKIKRNKKIR